MANNGVHSERKREWEPLLLKWMPVIEKDANRQWPRMVKRYLVALACVLVAFLIRYWLRPILGEELPFMLFIAAALVAAWYGGAVTGIVALMLGLLLADHFFVLPRDASRSLQLFRLVRYLFTASLGVILIEVLHRERRRNEAVLQELKEEVVRREAFSQALIETHEQLRQLTAELESRVEQRTEALQHTVQSLQDLLYQIAHHLRAPLRAGAGYLEMLRDEPASAAEFPSEEYVRRALDAIHRMHDLINDLLEYGYLIHAEAPLQEIQLETAVENVVAQFRTMFSARKVRVEIQGPLSRVKANQKLFRQVLLELLDNASKFVTPGVEALVRIKASPAGPKTVLWIEDNGIGVDPRYQERIFGAFERLHPQGEYEGNGIGLAIVRLAMERIGGRAGVESGHERGSRFWVEFPD